MKKIIIVLFLAFVVVGAASSLENLDIEAGAMVEGVGATQVSSLDSRVDLGPATLQFALGFTGVKLADPSLKVDDEDEMNIADDFTARLGVGMLQFGAYYDYWHPTPNMEVYSGLRYGFGFGRLNASVEDGDYSTDITANANLHKLKLIALGWDFSPSEMPNLVFSVGVGGERWWLGDINATVEFDDGSNSEEHDLVIDPGLSGWKTAVEVGARVRF